MKEDNLNVVEEENHEHTIQKGRTYEIRKN